MAGMNVDLTEATSAKRTYNISGYPTIIYFKAGKMQFNYGGEYNKDSLISWMRDPSPPKEKEAEKSWADEEDVQVTFLTDVDFDKFIASHKSVLVMFYAVNIIYI
jgi:protein disulfide isomerase family A protein 5